MVPKMCSKKKFYQNCEHNSQFGLSIHNFGQIYPKFLEEVSGTICHILRGDNHSQLCQLLQKQKIGLSTQNFVQIDPKFLQQVIGTVCHILRVDNHRYLKNRKLDVALDGLTLNFWTKLLVPFVIFQEVTILASSASGPKKQKLAVALTRLVR